MAAELSLDCVGLLSSNPHGGRRNALGAPHGSLEVERRASERVDERHRHAVLQQKARPPGNFGVLAAGVDRQVHVVEFVRESCAAAIRPTELSSNTTGRNASTSAQSSRREHRTHQRTDPAVQAVPVGLGCNELGPHKIGEAPAQPLSCPLGERRVTSCLERCEA